MITREQIYKFVYSLKSRTVTALRENQRYNSIPHVIDDNYMRHPSDITDGSSYRGSLENDYQDAESTLSEEELLAHRTNKPRIFYQMKYHLGDRDYYSILSEDHPETTIGILKVEDLPYKSLKSRIYKSAFAMSLESMVFLGYMTPFLLFIDGKAVCWNEIDVIHDGENSYLVIHNENYNWITLRDSNRFLIVTLPYEIEYLGIESNDVFNTNYNALVEYVTKSASIDEDFHLHINVPKIETTYLTNNNTFSIGYFMYRQYKLYKLGLLSDERRDKLRRIMITKLTYDPSSPSTVAETYSGKFNALDVDNFDSKIVNRMLTRPLDKYAERYLIGFERETGFTNDEGSEKYYLMSEHIYFNRQMTGRERAIFSDSNIKTKLQRENYLFFINNRVDVDYEPDELGFGNMVRIVNPDLDKVCMYTFYNTKLEEVYNSTTFKFKNKEYLLAKAREYFMNDHRLRDGISAILMDDEGNLTDNIIEHVDYSFTQNKTHADWDESKLDGLVDEDYALGALFLDENGEPTDDYIDFLSLVTEDEDKFEKPAGTLKVRLIGMPVDGFPEDDEGSFIINDGEFNWYAKIVNNTTIEYALAGHIDPRKHVVYGSINHIPQEVIVDYYNRHPELEPYENISIVEIEDAIDLNPSMIKALMLNDDNHFTGRTVDNLLVDPESDDLGLNLDGIYLLNHEEHDRKQYIDLCYDAYLDFALDPKDSYENNMENAFEAVLGYDAALFNRLVHTNVECVTYTGNEANSVLDESFGILHRKGLKISRWKYEGHESYCIVYVNGELFNQYYKMIVLPNYFFIPVEEDFQFNTDDQIEIMYFLNCNNNEIEFKLTDWVKNNKIISEDSKVNADVFAEWIDPNDLKIFEEFPNNILQYNTLLKRNEDVAFNVSFREDDHLQLIPDVYSNIADKFTAVSSRKFIYQRLYVDNKSYRIKLSSRFKYCDNQSQFIVFINGRRLNDKSFLITVPKYTRPFWDKYLYISKFVNPEDRIEIFYLPQEMLNINEYGYVKLTREGYIEADKRSFDIPLDGRYFTFFINGKKIAASDLEMISSNILRVKKDQFSLKDLVINTTYEDYIPEVRRYMKSRSLSIYDNIINEIRRSKYLGIAELNNLFQIYETMSDVEDDLIYQDVSHIAILNEIIRDFWVTSGYEYHKKPFLYDYELDEIVMVDDDGNYMLPSLDANKIANIPRDDQFHFVYFTTDPEVKLFERGSILNYIRFIWEYSTAMFSNQLNIISQSINGKKFAGDIREYEWRDGISEETIFKIIAHSPSRDISTTYNIKPVDPVYYGVVDESRLRYYDNSALTDLSDIIALIPKSGDLPTEAEMEAQQQTPYILEDLREHYHIFRNLIYIKNAELLLPSVFMNEIIAILPNEGEDLLDKEVWEYLSEFALDHAKDTHKWYDFDDYLLFDGFINMPIEFITNLKAIIPNDPDDVTGFHDWPVTYEQCYDYIIALNGFGKEMLHDQKRYWYFKDIKLFDPFNETEQIGTMDALTYWVYQRHTGPYILFNIETQLNPYDGLQKDATPLLLYDPNNNKFKEEVPYLLVDPLLFDADHNVIMNYDGTFDTGDIIYIDGSPIMSGDFMKISILMEVDQESGNFIDGVAAGTDDSINISDAYYVDYETGENLGIVGPMMALNDDGSITSYGETFDVPIDSDDDVSLVDGGDIKLSLMLNEDTSGDTINGDVYFTDGVEDYTFEDSVFVDLENSGNIIATMNNNVSIDPEDDNIIILDLDDINPDQYDIYGVLDRVYDVQVYTEPTTEQLMPFDEHGRLVINYVKQLEWWDRDGGYDRELGRNENNYYVANATTIKFAANPLNVYSMIVLRDPDLGVGDGYDDHKNVGYNRLDTELMTGNKVWDLDDVMLMDIAINDAELTRGFFTVYTNMLMLKSDFWEELIQSDQEFFNTLFLNDTNVRNYISYDGEKYTITSNYRKDPNKVGESRDELLKLIAYADLKKGSKFVIEEPDFYFSRWEDQFDMLAESNYEAVKNSVYNVEDVDYIMGAGSDTITTWLDYMRAIANDYDGFMEAIDNGTADEFIYNMDNPPVEPDPKPEEPEIDDGHIYNEYQLKLIRSYLNKYLHDGIELDINYPMGNYNYFVVALPKKECFNKYNERKIRWITQDFDERLKNNTYVDINTPLYTSGRYNVDNTLQSLDEMHMIYLGDYNNVTDYGIEQEYSVWATDGFFTKIYEDFPINIQIKKNNR